MRVALIPVRPLERAKGRLSGLLSAEARAALMSATLRTVIEAASGAGLIPVVLTADRQAATAAGPLALILDEDPAAQGLTGQVAAAIPRIEALAGAAPELIVVLHADLPLASPEAVQDLLAAVPPAPSVTLVPSADGGTTVLVLNGGAVIGSFGFAYGPGSAAAHGESGRALGIEPAIVAIAALSLDLDTPDDVAAFLALPEAPGTPAGAVLRRYLADGLSPPGRLP